MVSEMISVSLLIISSSVFLYRSSEIRSVLKHSDIISALWTGVALHSTV